MQNKLEKKDKKEALTHTLPLLHHRHLFPSSNHPLPPLPPRPSPSLSACNRDSKVAAICEASSNSYLLSISERNNLKHIIDDRVYQDLIGDDSHYMRPHNVYDSLATYQLLTEVLIKLFR